MTVLRSFDIEQNSTPGKIWVVVSVQNYFVVQTFLLIEWSHYW